MDTYWILVMSGTGVLLTVLTTRVIIPQHGFSIPWNFVFLSWGQPNSLLGSGPGNRISPQVSLSHRTEGRVLYTALTLGVRTSFPVLHILTLKRAPSRFQTPAGAEALRLPEQGAGTGVGISSKHRNTGSSTPLSFQFLTAELSQVTSF